MSNRLKAAGIIAFLVISAGAYNRWATEQNASGGLTGTIEIDGSSTVFPITQAVAEEFQKVYPSIRVNVGVSGTGGGFKRFTAGETDINDASRPIKGSEEERAAQNGVQYLELRVALDGIAVVVSTSNTIQIMAEEVEDRATELIALHQPMAGDLRTLKAYIKIAYDLERYGRYAMFVSEIQYRLGVWKPLEDEALSVKELSDKTLQVIDMSLAMIETLDEKMIFDLSKVETETDELYFENMRLFSECKGDPKTVVAYLLTIRYLERIADHGSYIAESISYAATGKRISIR
ncbi:MAG: PhoU domain-containing protein [Candidatus Bathyarchaeota archaeon]